jgi:hypothetical protein
VKIGVRIGPPDDRVGEWLADAAAYDAAGAHLLWIDTIGRTDLDDLVLAAALAAVTHRALLVCADTAGRALTTVRLVSRGRIRLAGRGCDLRPGPIDPTTFDTATGELWAEVDGPTDRAAWATMLVDAATHRRDGLIVPAGPRLLDLLRNPGEPGERHDLQLTVG